MDGLLLIEAKTVYKSSFSDNREKGMVIVLILLSTGCLNEKITL